MLAEHARADTRALAAKAALHAASSAEVAVIVAPLRALLEAQTQHVIAARERTTAAAAGEVERITRALRGLAEWLAAFASAQHGLAVAATQAAPETTRQPDRAPLSRARPSPHAPAIAPPGSATVLPPEPAQLAAGLTRPSARPIEAQPRGMTMIGLAAPSAPRGAQPSAPTLLSMQAVASPPVRPAPPVAIEGQACDRRGTGAP